MGNAPSLKNLSDQPPAAGAHPPGGFCDIGNKISYITKKRPLQNAIILQQSHNSTNYFELLAPQ